MPGERRAVAASRGQKVAAAAANTRAVTRIAGHGESTGIADALASNSGGPPTRFHVTALPSIFPLALLTGPGKKWYFYIAII